MTNRLMYVGKSKVKVWSIHGLQLHKDAVAYMDAKL